MPRRRRRRRHSRRAEAVAAKAAASYSPVVETVWSFKLLRDALEYPSFGTSASRSSDPSGEEAPGRARVALVPKARPEGPSVLALRVAIALGCLCSVGCGSRTSLSDTRALTCDESPAAGLDAVATTLASLPTAAGEIAVDSENVYWANLYEETSDPGAPIPPLIMSIPKTGGTPVVLAAVRGFPSGIAVDSERVYWTVLISVDAETQTYEGRLWGVPKTGGAAALLASEPGRIVAMAMDDDNLYWANPDTRSIMSVAKAGGSPVTLASGLAYLQAGIQVSATSVYWTISSEVPSEGALLEVPKRGGNVVTLASGIFGESVAVDNDSVYWSRFDDSAALLMRMPRNGGTAMVLASTSSVPDAIVLDESYVYWTTPGTPRGDAGGVWAVAKNGGAPVMLAPGGAYGTLTPLAVDCTSVYWGIGSTLGGPTSPVLLELTPK
jgi:hypothetical protein